MEEVLRLLRKFRLGRCWCRQSWKRQERGEIERDRKRETEREEKNTCNEMGSGRLTERRHMHRPRRHRALEHIYLPMVGVGSLSFFTISFFFFFLVFRCTSPITRKDLILGLLTTRTSRVKHNKIIHNATWCSLSILLCRYYGAHWIAQEGTVSCKKEQLWNLVAKL